jgi:hypothetical protein
MLDLKLRYNLIIDVDKELIFDGPDPQRPWFSSTAIDIKLVDEDNKEINLDSCQKNDIKVVLLKIIEGFQ